MTRDSGYLMRVLRAGVALEDASDQARRAVPSKAFFPVSISSDSDKRECGARIGVLPSSDRAHVMQRPRIVPSP